jgi:hypothetical protein
MKYKMFQLTQRLMKVFFSFVYMTPVTSVISVFVGVISCSLVATLKVDVPGSSKTVLSF